MATSIISAGIVNRAGSEPAPLDRNHPLARGLIYAAGDFLAPPGITDGSAYFGRTHGLLANVAQSAGTQHGYFVGDVPDMVGGPFGPALSFDGTRKAFTQSITGVANGAAADESCVVVCTLSSSSGSQHLFGFGNVWSSSLSDYGRGVGIESGQVMAWGASASNGKRVYATLPALNTPVVIAVRFAVDGALFINGVKVASGDMSHSWGYYLATGAAVAGIDSVELANFTGLIGPRRWWSRGLADKELIDASRNPRAIYRQLPRVAIVTIGAAATTGTLAGTLAALAVTAAAVVANGPGATLSGTLGALALASSAAVANGPAATLAGTLGTLTLAADASVGSGPAATLGGTLGALTLAAGATVANGPAATLSATLAALTLTAEATSNTGPTAAVAGTLGTLTITSAATVANGPAAILAGTLAALSVSSAAEVTNYVAPAETSATLASTLAVLTLVSSATIAGPDADLPRARRIGPPALSPASRRAVTLRAARRIGDSTLRRAA